MNHPHEQQAAAMARAGELTDGEQLRECINSGQVSAAQVVAHAENGDIVALSAAYRRCSIPNRKCTEGCGNGPCRIEIRNLRQPTGWPLQAGGLLQDDSRQLSKALSRDPNARALVREAVAHQEAGELPAPLIIDGHYRDHMDKVCGYTANQMRAYATAALAAERAEVARLRTEIEAIREDASDWARYVIEDNAPMTLKNYITREMDRRAAIAAGRKAS